MRQISEGLRERVLLCCKVRRNVINLMELIRRKVGRRKFVSMSKELKISWLAFTTDKLLAIWVSHSIRSTSTPSQVEFVSSQRLVRARSDSNISTDSQIGNLSLSTTLPNPCGTTPA